MPITLDEIVEETRHWPPEKVGELVGRLTEDLNTSDPEIEAAWKAEIDRRIEEIQSGKVKGIPALAGTTRRSPVVIWFAHQFQSAID
jgi:putative addiction module component (TIGR02574 family)